MKKLFLIGVLFLWSCANKNKESKTNLPMQTMQKTVWQLMQVDEYLSRQIRTDTSVNPAIEKANYYQSVFNLNKVDRVRFYATMNYLEKHPDEYKTLIDSVEALSKREKLALIKH